LLLEQEQEEAKALLREVRSIESEGSGLYQQGHTPGSVRQKGEGDSMALDESDEGEGHTR
jgi:Tfp pilus assembly protein PilN